MKDERYWPVLGTWLKDTAAAPPDSRQAARKVASRLPQTPQLPRRWWLPPLFARRSRSAPDDAEHSSVVDGLSTDRLPIVTRRTMTMLSPVKAIVAGSFIALGGLLLIAQPMAQPEVGAPGAERTDLSGASVNVTQECVSHDSCIWTASDPRLTGTLAHEWLGGVDVEPTVGGGLGAGFDYAEVTFEGPEGSWTGHLYALWPEPSQGFLVLSGAGANEGWQYVASYIDPEPDGDLEWTGTLYEGALPPYGPLTATSDG